MKNLITQTFRILPKLQKKNKGTGTLCPGPYSSASGEIFCPRPWGGRERI